MTRAKCHRCGHNLIDKDWHCTPTTCIFRNHPPAAWFIIFVLAGLSQGWTDGWKATHA